MKMTPNKVAQINQQFFGDPHPAKDVSVQFNVFRHSCELRHPIAHGTLTVTYSAATRAHKTIETYEILGTPYEVTGWLVQPEFHVLPDFRHPFRQPHHRRAGDARGPDGQPLSGAQEGP